MLNDSQMSKLAEMCEFRNVNDVAWYVEDDAGVDSEVLVAYYHHLDDDHRLTLAGYFVVIEKLDLHVKPSEYKKGWVAFFRNDVWCRTGATLPAAIDAALQEILGNESSSIRF